MNDVIVGCIWVAGISTYDHHHQRFTHQKTKASTSSPWCFLFFFFFFKNSVISFGELGYLV